MTAPVSSAPAVPKSQSRKNREPLIAAPRLPEQVRVRMNKLDALRAKGIDAYPVGQPPSHAISAALAEVDGTPVSVAGRVLRIRDYGGVIFAQLRDWSGEIQVLLDNSALESGSNTGCFTAAIDLGDLVEATGQIDVAISPQQATIGALLTHIRRGDVVRVHALRRGAAEAIEAVAHGDRQTSKVVGRRIDEIRLPSGTTIGAVVRNGEVTICHHDTLIEPDDHVILFLTDKKRIHEVERLFQVAVTFL